MENRTAANTGKTAILAWLYTLFTWMVIDHFIYIFG
jgi:hypothetical protein